MKEKVLSDQGFLESKMRLIMTIVITIFLMTYLALILLEGLNLLDSLYFIVITLSTVGYGDIAPQNPITKILLVLLIISTLTVLATVSESLIDRVVTRRRLRLYLPEEGLNWKGHIVIADINDLSLQLAKMLDSRFMDVVILDPDEDKVVKTRSDNITAYIASVDDQETISRLNLEEADVIFLFMEKNESLLKTSIIIRSYTNQIPIYALTPEGEIEQDFANQVGISRVYSYPRIISSFISVITRQLDLAIIADQKDRDAYYYYIISFPPQHKQLEEIVGIHKTIGIFSFSQLTFHNLHTERFMQFTEGDITGSMGDTYSVFSIFPKENYDQIEIPKRTFDSEQLDLEARFHHIIILGFDQTIEQMISHLRVPADRFIIVTANRQYYDKILQMDIDARYLDTHNDLIQFISTDIHGDDIVFNMIEDLEKALRATIEIRKKEELITIFQLVSDKYETEVFKNFNVQGFVNPDLLVVRAMMQYYLRYSQYSLSTINEGSHIFEYIVHQGSIIEGKPLKYLLDNNYDIILHRRKGERNELDREDGIDGNTVIREGDVLLLEKSV